MCIKTMRSVLARVGANHKPNQICLAPKVHTGQNEQVHTGQNEQVHTGQNGNNNGKQQQRNSGSGAVMAGAALVGCGVMTFLFENRKLSAEEQQAMIHENTANLASKTITTKNQKINRFGGMHQMRMRQFSTPDQTFHYFSSYLLSQRTKVEGRSKMAMMMSPMDLFHAITPDKVSDYEYDSKILKTLNQEELPGVKLDQSPVENSVLNQIGYEGLIAYNDFCFLLTLLSTPRRYITTAFELFDINADGVLDAKEFAYASSKLAYNAGGFGDYQNTPKDHTIMQEQTDNSQSGVLNYLFGKDRTKTLDSKRFVYFITKLQDEIIELEFREYDTKNTGRITEEDLANFLVKNSKLPVKVEKRMMNRIKRTWPKVHQNQGVSLPSFKNLYQALMGGEDLQRAMYFLDQGEGVDYEEFQKIFKWVSKQDLSDHVAKVMFVLFDNDVKGKIASHDVQNVLCNWRKSRGFEKLIIHASVGQGWQKRAV